jgi:hypothetical protein
VSRTLNRAHWSAGLALTAWMTAAGALVAGNGCITSVDSGAIAPLALPDKDQFITQGVSTFMEKRCGALDCHGQIGRPLRIYSSSGLRKNDGPNGGRDTSGTSVEEMTDNYYSVVGLEPEAISIARVTADTPEGTYTDFLLLKKPLGIEGNGVRHKGGPVLRSTDSGFECLIRWIEGAADKAKCDDGAKQ